MSVPALDDARLTYVTRLKRIVLGASFTVANLTRLLSFFRSAGAKIFKTKCAQCHVVEAAHKQVRCEDCALTYDDTPRRPLSLVPRD